MTEKLFCHTCQKRLSKKTARLVEGKLWCSACLFPPLDKRKIVQITPETDRALRRALLDSVQIVGVIPRRKVGE